MMTIRFWLHKQKALIDSAGLTIEGQGLLISLRLVKKKPVDVFTRTGFIKMIRRYLLSHLQYYHRLKVLNYCVRDGNRCDHFDMFAGRDRTGLFTRCDLILTDHVFWLLL